MFLTRYSIVDGKVVEDPTGDWCRLGFVAHLVETLQSDILDLEQKLAAARKELDDKED